MDYTLWQIVGDHYTLADKDIWKNFSPTWYDFVVVCREPPTLANFFVGDENLAVSRQKYLC